jgi:hypothetical protein
MGYNRALVTVHHPLTMLMQPLTQMKGDMKVHRNRVEANHGIPKGASYGETIEALEDCFQGQHLATA